MTKYTPTTDHVRVAYQDHRDFQSAVRGLDRPGDVEAGREFDRWLAQHDAEVACKALAGLSAWLGDLAEKHPARSAHVPLMQGHITRYITNNYPEGDDQ